MFPPCIEVKGLSRTYRVGDIDVQALRGVDLSIAPGEMLAIMGASGSGKSTLMAILGCLDRASQGSYLFEGVDIATLQEAALADIRCEKLGFVFQSFNLLPRTSALDNVALPLLYVTAGAGRLAQRRQLAAAMLASIGLAGRENNTPAQLSGGQQQRVAIARALINSPSVLLADEPTGNLDTHTSHDIMQTLVRLNREQGVTVIVVTHDPDIAAYARRVVTMRDGQIVSDQRASGPAAARAPPAPSSAPALEHAGPPAAAAAWQLMRMVFTVAGQALWRNKIRSALTMLGVFIGVAALIAMIALGRGANEAVRAQIESLGTNLFVVVPGAATSGGVRAGFGSASTLTVADAEAIARESTQLAAVSYLIRQGGQVAYGDRNWSTQLQGVTPAYPSATNWRVIEGRALNEADERAAALVAVIGDTVYRQLFSADDTAVGRMILVRGIALRVVGLYAAKGQTAYGQDQDDIVMMPFTTAARRVLGVATPSQANAANNLYPQAPNPFGLQPRLTGYVNQIYVQAASSAQLGAAIDEVTATLNRRHRIKPGDVADFNVRNLSQIADTATGSSRVLALLLAIVASISLLVGGIGIMNILLVSVAERTREIGLRMAIGAHRRHVLLQFLTEAVFMSVVGGVAGILAGVVVSRLISALAGWPTVIAPAAVLGGFAFAAAVGIFFGYYPARKAARLDPIEALRYE